MPPKSMRAKPNVSAKRADVKRGVKRASADMIAQSESTDASETVTGFTSNARATATHVYFWGGILSNWWLRSPAFPGSTCLDHVLPELDRLEVPHPPHDALSTQILAAHPFVCGEQWMMAVKAWLFERTSELGEMTVRKEQGDVGPEGVIGKDRFQSLRKIVMYVNSPKTDTSTPEEREIHAGTLCQILRATAPRTQKSLGRKVRGFDDEVWTKACRAIVVASCIARAQVDPVLRQVYQDASGKKFVEGSPMDTIWGVGLKWDNPKIDDEPNWRGENRLGECHDAAAKHIREKFNA